jgi:hypothetical protein
MQDRDIPEAAISSVIDDHHTRQPAPRGRGTPAQILIGEVSGRDLKVYAEMDSNPIMIKTAVWDGD